MAAQRRILAYIVDYACRYRHESVIQAALERHNDTLASLGVPHARLAGFSLYKTVHHGLVHHFPTAIRLLEELFHELGDQSNPAFVKCFIKLLCGLKVKAFFYTLEKSPQHALKALTEYFPRETNTDVVMSPELAGRLRQATKDFRKGIYPIILHPSKRDEFMANQYEDHYGKDFCQMLKRHMTSFLDTLEQHWPDTFLDKIIKQQQEGNTSSTCSFSTPPSPDGLTDILLDFVEGKPSLQAQDLLDLLDLFDPQRPLDILGFTSSFFNSQAVGLGDMHQPTGGQVPADRPTEGSQTASQEHVISSSSDSNNTNSGPTDSQTSQQAGNFLMPQPLLDRQQEVHVRESDESPLLRPWSEENKEVPDFYSDGSISDVDNMGQDSKTTVMEQDSTVDREETEVVPSSYSTGSECEACSQASQLTPQRQQHACRSRPVFPHRYRQMCPHRCQALRSQYSKLLYPNICSHRKNKAVRLCVVKLQRQPELDSLDPAEGVIQIT